MTYKPPANPWEPPPLEEFEIIAIRSLQHGVASAGQQQLALKVIVQKFAATYDMSFRPDIHGGERGTCFMEGRRFVGNRILEAIDRPMKTRPQEKTDGRTPDPAAEPPGRINPKPSAPRRKPTAPGKAGG